MRRCWRTPRGEGDLARLAQGGRGIALRWCWRIAFAHWLQRFHHLHFARLVAQFRYAQRQFALRRAALAHRLRLQNCDFIHRPPGLGLPQLHPRHINSARTWRRQLEDVGIGHVHLGHLQRLRGLRAESE